MPRRKKQTIGYRHFLGVHFVACLGPIDHISRVEVAEREVININTGEGDVYINKPEMFGGERKEGGIQGTISVHFGNSTQVPNTYLQSILGSVIPAFRGVVSIVLRQVYLGSNPYLKPWAFRVQRILAVPPDLEFQWYPERARIFQRYVDTISGHQSIYIAPDFSLSMDGTRRLTVIAAIQGFLDYVGTLLSTGLTFDIAIQPWAGISLSYMQRRNVTLVTLAELKAHIASILVASSTDFTKAFTNNASFFAGSPTPSRKIIVFITDGVPSAIPTPIANATAAAALIGGVEVFGFNIDLPDTTYTAIVDNTDGDGVPVIQGDDPITLQLLMLGQRTEFDMNPIHIISEVISNYESGGEIVSPFSDDIFGIGWEEAADVLYNESFGLSFLWSSTSQRQEFINLIEGHIDAKVYVSRDSNKFQIKLIREDYDINLLYVFDKNNVISWDEIRRPELNTLPNQITVVWTDPNKTDEASLTITNPARVMQAGRIINVKRQYLGINRADTASRVALRDLATLSAPLLTGNITVTNLPTDLNLGSPILINNPRIGVLNVVVRIIEITDGDGRSHQSIVRFIEDRFSLSQEGLIVIDPPYVPPTTVPAAATPRMVEELPYYEFVRIYGQSAANDLITADPELGFLHVSAGTSNSSYDGEIYADVGAGYTQIENVNFAPSTTIYSSMSARSDHKVVIAADTNSILTLVEIGSLAIVDNEYMEVESIVAGGAYLPGDYYAPPITPPAGSLVTITFGRGCLDTPPRTHIANSKVIFWFELSSSAEVEYNDGEVINVKIRTNTRESSLALADAPVDTFTFDQRLVRPYAPGKLQEAGNYFGNYWTGSLVFTWAHRNRLSQTTDLFDDHTVGSIGPEVGTTYVVEAFQYTGSVRNPTPIYTNTGLSGLTDTIDTSLYSPSGGATFVDVEVNSIRSGLRSRNASIIRFTVFYANDHSRTLEQNNDDRVLETSDDIRAIEG